MKYRMEQDAVGGYNLRRDGDSRDLMQAWNNVGYYHEAAVEFWQEIERLRASQAELVEAIGRCIADLEELESAASLAEEKARNADVCNYQNGKRTAYDMAIEMVRAALARVERKERGE